MLQTQVLLLELFVFWNTLRVGHCNKLRQNTTLSLRQTRFLLSYPEEGCCFQTRPSVTPPRGPMDIGPHWELGPVKTMAHFPTKSKVEGCMGLTSDIKVGIEFREVVSTEEEKVK